MVKIIANQALPYGKRRYAAGEEVEVSEKDAKLLIGIRRARAAAEAPPIAAPLTTMTPPAVKALEPEPAQAAAAPAETVTEAAPEAPTHPQTYSRRDMVAEPTPGPTGSAKSSPSSRRAPPHKGRT